MRTYYAQHRLERGATVSTVHVRGAAEALERAPGIACGEQWTIRASSLADAYQIARRQADRAPVNSPDNQASPMFTELP